MIGASCMRALQRISFAKRKYVPLRSGTSYEEIWACAAAAYCYLVSSQHNTSPTGSSIQPKHLRLRARPIQYADFRRCHLPRGVRPEPDLLMDNAMVFQYDGQYYHAGREESDAKVNRAHSKLGYRVVRLRDRLDPLPGCENIISINPSLSSVQRDIFVHFGAADQYTVEARETVATWAKRRIEELARYTEGREPGLEWLRVQVSGGEFDDRWRCVQFEDPNVYSAHQNLCKEVGPLAYAAAMRTPLSSSLHLAPVWREIRWWVKTLGERSFATLMNRRGVAGGLERRAFRCRMREWVRKLGSQHFTAWACNSVASRLERPAFNRSMRRWLRELGPRLLAKWMCDGVASRIECPAFNRRARSWLGRLCRTFGRDAGRTCFPVWMNNSVARRLDDPHFDRVAREWLAMVETAPHYVLIFHGCFVSRLHRKPFEARAREMFREMGSARFSAFVNRNRGRRLDRAFVGDPSDAFKNPKKKM